MADYNLYPSVDKDYNFPPPIRKQFIESPEIYSAIVNEVTARSAGKVTGDGILRIVASKNPDLALKNGDLLLVLETPMFWTNFSEYASGSQPSDWKNEWANADWKVMDMSATNGGKILRYTATVQARRTLSWNKTASAAAAHADQEIVLRWRSSTHDAAGRALLRGSGGLSDGSGYYASYSPTESVARLGLYLEGAAPASANVDSKEIAYAANTWYRTRARIEGGRRMMKIWRDGTTEPTAWSVEAAAPQILTPGFLGIMCYGIGTADIDWVGMAFDGGTAPSSAV